MSHALCIGLTSLGNTECKSSTISASPSDGTGDEFETTRTMSGNAGFVFLLSNEALHDRCTCSTRSFRLSLGSKSQSPLPSLSCCGLWHRLRRLSEWHPPASSSCLSLLRQLELNTYV